MNHTIEIHPDDFEPILLGNKSFIVIANHLEFQKWDVLTFVETTFPGTRCGCTGRKVQRVVGHVTGNMQKKNTVVLGFDLVTEWANAGSETVEERDWFEHQRDLLLVALRKMEGLLPPEHEARDLALEAIAEVCGDAA